MYAYATTTDSLFMCQEEDENETENESFRLF